MNPENTPAITFQQKKNDVIKLNQRKNALKIQKSSGMLAQKLTAVVGPTYALSFLFGGLYGLISAKPPLIQRSSFKLKMNYYLNTIGKTSAKFANYSAAALFLYLIIAKSTDYIFKEELQGLNKNAKTAIFGGLTGAVYRVGFPMKAVLFSTCMGSMAACMFNQAWERGFVQIKLV